MMQFKFIKEDDNIKVMICHENTEFDFDYIKMINLLYNQKAIEASAFVGSFLGEEIDNINAFVQELSLKITSSAVLQSE